MSELTKESFMVQFNGIVAEAKKFFNLEAEEAVATEVVAEAADAPVFVSHTTKNGEILLVEGELVEGMRVEMQLADGDETAPDGVYELETGEVLTIADGVLTAIEASPLGPDSGESMEEMKAAFEAKFSELEKSSNAKYEVLLKAIQNSGELMAKFADTPVTGEESNVATPKQVHGVAKASSALSKLGNKK